MTKEKYYRILLFLTLTKNSSFVVFLEVLTWNTVCCDNFAGLYFCRLVILCILQELIFVIRTDY